jgi:hypothetical protein
VLDRIVGQRVSSVCFVEDYWQLVLEDATVSFVNATKISASGADHDLPDESRLRGLIGAVVAKTEIEPNDEMRLVFGTAVVLSVTLRPQDYRWGPEAVMIQHADGSFDVW